MRAIKLTLAAAVTAGVLLSGMARGATAGTRPAATPATTQAAPQDVVAVLLEQLADYHRYAETQWHEAAGHPGMGYWGSGRADGGNEGARSQSINAFIYAALAARGDKNYSIAERVDPALRYTAATHVTGSIKGTKNDKWGNSWQSAMYAGDMGLAALLAGKQLSPETMEAVKRVVAYEADRFIDQPPPSMLPGDTKAEENAWDLAAPAAAECLMPEHPHAKQWHETVERWAFNTLSVAADKKNQDIVDGRPISEWVSTTQLFPDFTLENHNIFHPVYEMVGAAGLGQVAVNYAVAKQHVPYALRWGVMREFDNALKYITLADGEWLYPQGLDWDLHDYEHLHYWTMLATMYQNPLAALMESRTAWYGRKRQIVNGDGRLVGPSSNLGFARESVQAERVCFAVLMHDLFRKAPAVDPGEYERMASTIAPEKTFPFVGLAVHRSEGGLVSMSWKNHLCAQLAPESAKHLDQPYVTTPMTDTLVGRFGLKGQAARDAAKFKINGHGVGNGPDLSVAVDASINDGRLRQQIGFVSVAPGVVVYLDRVTANQDVTVTDEVALPISIENDNVSGDRRTVYTAGGAAEAKGGAEQTLPLAGNWVNVDGRLAVIYPEDAHPTYRIAGKYNRPGAREDLLVARGTAGGRSFHKGDVVAARAAVLLLNASPEQTAAVAGGTRFESSGDAPGVRVKLEGRELEVRLRSDGTLSFGGNTLHPSAEK